MNRENKLVKNTLVLGIGTLVSSGFSFILIPIFSRWLSSGEYGTFDLYNTYVSLMLPFLTLSSGEAAFRFLLDCGNQTESRRVINTSTVIAFAGVILGTAGIAAYFFGTDNADFLPFVFLMLTSILYRQLCYYVRGLRKLSVYTISNVVYLLVMAAAVTWLVFYRKMGLSGIMYGNAIGYLAGAVYLFGAAKMWRYTALQKPDFTQMREFILYAMPLIPSAISWWIVNVSDRTIINIFLGATANGIYAIAYKVPSLCTTLFSIFHMSWQESAVDAIKDDDRSDYINRVLNRILPLSLSVGMGVMGINRYMYRWVWDVKYADGYFHICILVTAVIFAFLAQYLGGVLVAQKRTKANGLTIVIAAGINIAVNVALIQTIGLFAASVSTLVAYMAMFFIRLALIRKEFSIQIHRNAWLAIGCYALMVGSQFLHSEAAGLIALGFAAAASVLLNRATILHLAGRVFKKKQA